MGSDQSCVATPRRARRGGQRSKLCGDTPHSPPRGGQRSKLCDDPPQSPPGWAAIKLSSQPHEVDRSLVRRSVSVARYRPPCPGLTNSGGLQCCPGPETRGVFAARYRPRLPQLLYSSTFCGGAAEGPGTEDASSESRGIEVGPRPAITKARNDESPKHKFLRCLGSRS